MYWKMSLFLGLWRNSNTCQSKRAWIQNFINLSGKYKSKFIIKQSKLNLVPLAGCIYAIIWTKSTRNSTVLDFPEAECRSSHQKCSVTEGVLIEILQYLQGKTPVSEYLFKWSCKLRPATLVRKDSWTGAFL